MRAIVIHPRHNSHGKRDVTGAFRPEAKRFAALHGIPDECVVSFDNSATKPRRRAEVEALIWEHRAGDLLDMVAVFSHGTMREIQTGHTTRGDSETLHSLAQVIAMRSVPEVRVALYCCSTASASRADESRPGPGGDGGPADKLRDWLSTEGCVGGHVDAHATVGHATRNPHVRRFYTVGNTTGELVDVPGTDWLVAPTSVEWRAWRRRLAGDDDMRLRFPSMSATEIVGTL